MLAPPNPASPTETPQPLSPSLPHPALPHPSSRLKGIWPRAFPSPLKASSLAYLAARRTEPPAQTAVQAADRRVAVELEQATAAEKMAWTSALAEGIPRQTTPFPAQVDPRKSARPLRARSSSRPIPTPSPMTPPSEPDRRISPRFLPLPSPSRSSPQERSTKCSSTCPT